MGTIKDVGVHGNCPDNFLALSGYLNVLLMRELCWNFLIYGLMKADPHMLSIRYSFLGNMAKLILPCKAKLSGEILI